MGNRRDKTKAVAAPIDTDPRSLALRLLAYAHRYAASVGWRTNDTALARGQGVEDVVQDALSSLYGGEPGRRWDPAKHLDPMDHLRSFVNSRLSTLGRSYDNRQVRRGVNPDAYAGTQTPETLLVEQEEQRTQAAWHARARDLLLQEILADDVLVRLYDLVEKEEIGKPAELAARLGVKVEDVKNAKKRLRRAWECVVKMMDEQGWDSKAVLHG